MAGSESALEFLERLERTQSGSPISRFAAELRADVQADRRVLEDLMERIQISASRPRKAGAWLAEKLSELKLRLDDRSDGPLRQLEVFEALSLGIEGKRLLWRALRATSGYSPNLNGPDYDGLERRAEKQRARVELMRLDAAIVALGATQSTAIRPASTHTGPALSSESAEK